MNKILLTIICFFFTMSSVEASIILGRRGQEVLNQTLGITTIGSNIGTTGRARKAGNSTTDASAFTTPAAGICVSHGYWYGNTADGGTDGTITMAIFNTSDVQQGDCSASGSIVDGHSPEWIEVVFSPCISLAGSTEFYVAAYPSEEVDYSFETVIAGDGAWLDNDVELTTCATVVEDNSTNRTAMYVANYDAYDYGGGDQQIYYLTQAGAGSNASGTGAWVSAPTSTGQAMSVAQFNNAANWSGSESAMAIDPGDIVYFSGTITSQVTPQGSGTAGLPVTLDGYAAGDADPIGDGSMPVGTAAITPTGTNNGIYIEGKSFITVQDFLITSSGIGMRIYGPSPNLNIRRNYFYDCNAALNANAAANYTSNMVVEDNRFENYGTVGDTPHGLSFIRADDLVIRGNRFTGDTGVTTSSNYIEMHLNNRVLVEYNWFDPTVNISNVNGANITFKEPGSGNNDVIFRFNKSTYTLLNTNADWRSADFSWEQASGYYVYGNYIYAGGEADQMGIGITSADGADDVNIWSNIISGNPASGVNLWARGQEKRLTNIKFYNNTLYGNASHPYNDNTRGGFVITDNGADNVLVKNNIFMNNRPNISDRRQISDYSDRINQLEHNTYYHTSGAPTIRRDGADRTLATIQGTYSLESVVPAGVIADPGLVSPGTGDFTLDGTHVENGFDLSGTAGEVIVQGVTYTMLWQTALHPDTDWTGQPSATKIITANQNDYTDWERGAYIYVAP